jgi:hypothetical protein
MFGGYGVVFAGTEWGEAAPPGVFGASCKKKNIDIKKQKRGVAEMPQNRGIG